mgnify:CR=1 FL=1
MTDRLSDIIDLDRWITTSNAAGSIQRFGNCDDAIDLNGSGRIDQSDLLIFISGFESYRDN